MPGQHGRHLPKVKPSASRLEPAGHSHSRHGVTEAPYQALSRHASALPNFRHLQDPQRHLQQILGQHAPLRSSEVEDFAEVKASFHGGSKSLPSFSRHILEDDCPPTAPRSSERRPQETRMRDVLRRDETNDNPLARLSRAPKGKLEVPASGIPASVRIRILWEPSHVAFAQRYFPERCQGSSKGAPRS